MAFSRVLLYNANCDIELMPFTTDPGYGNCFLLTVSQIVSYHKVCDTVMQRETFTPILSVNKLLMRDF